MFSSIKLEGVEIGKCCHSRVKVLSRGQPAIQCLIGMRPRASRMVWRVTGDRLPQRRVQSALAGYRKSSTPKVTPSLMNMQRLDAGTPTTDAYASINLGCWLLPLATQSREASLISPRSSYTADVDARNGNHVTQHLLADSHLLPDGNTERNVRFLVPRLDTVTIVRRACVLRFRRVAVQRAAVVTAPASHNGGESSADSYHAYGLRARPHSTSEIRETLVSCIRVACTD
ncbi:unnamed protein product, partial [Iphiclides podalirius]